MPGTLVKFLGKAFGVSKRNFGIFTPALQKASDPIQQLFLDKIREYKSKTSGGKLVEPSPEMEKEFKNDRERVFRQYNVKAGEDLTKFPSFSFTDPKIEKPEIIRGPVSSEK